MSSVRSVEQYQFGPSSSTPPSNGRISSRSRRGCWGCRDRSVRKRCGMQWPSCRLCVKKGLVCDYTPQPRLAERRKALAIASLQVRLIKSPVFEIETGSLTLSFEDQEAVHYFRTGFAQFHHTKNRDYGLISLMFKIAMKTPMVMHMVIAIGLKEMDFRRPRPIKRLGSLEHHGAAISLMREAMQLNDAAQDLDSVYTTLWLVLLYEQQFGDAECVHYASHLEGMSALLQCQRDRHLNLALQTPGSEDTTPIFLESSVRKATSNVSVYAARVLVWIALLDAAAASSGVGGQVNTTILTMLPGNETTSGLGGKDPVQAFAHLYRYSNSLYRRAWGCSYPPTELMDDLENRNIYAFLCACAQLRFMTAQLATLHRRDPAAAADRARDVGSLIDQVGNQFTDLIEVASELCPKTDHSHRLVTNIRAIVPVYHAVVLEFMRLTAFEQPLGERQRYALKQIINLARQGYTHDGDKAMIRIAWPLFIAAIETDNLHHRKWTLDRFETMSQYGKNFQRAHQFLLRVIPLQSRLGSRIDVRDEMEKTAFFVLG